MNEESNTRADKLITDIAQKLSSNKSILERAPHGQITWRWSNGKWQIELRPTL